jgi:hypothetical protein
MSYSPNYMIHLRKNDLSRSMVFPRIIIKDAFLCSCKYVHIKIAEWLFMLGYRMGRLCMIDALCDSCSNGHLEIAKWLYGVDCFTGCFEHTFTDACVNGHLKTAKWICEISTLVEAYGYDGKDIEREKAGIVNVVLANCCATSRLNIVKWLVDIGADINDKEAFIIACVTSNNMEMVK